jgi:hypothetical protein
MIPKQILRRLTTPSKRNKSIDVSMKLRSKATFTESELERCLYGERTAKKVKSHGDA